MRACAGEEAATGTHEGEDHDAAHQWQLSALRARLLQKAVLDREQKEAFNKLATDAITVDHIMNIVGTLQSAGAPKHRPGGGMGRMGGLQGFQFLC